MYVYVYVTKVYIKRPATTFTQFAYSCVTVEKADNIAQTMTDTNDIRREIEHFNFG